MQLKRTVMFACGGAALAAWLAAAATSGVHAPAQPAQPAAPAAQPDTEFESEVARLHERLTPAAVPVHPARDLFRFAPDRTRPAPARARAAIVEAAAAPAVPVRPAIKLAGIAIDGPADAIVRTAILSTQGQLFLAKEGEAVTARYKVVRISDDVVELLDVVDNTTLRLPLR